MYLSLTESPQNLRVSSSRTNLLAADSVAHAVLQRCRSQSLTVGVILCRKLDEAMCEVEAALAMEDAPGVRNPVDGGSLHSSAHQGETDGGAQRRESADATGADGELSFFIPTVDSEESSLASQTEEEKPQGHTAVDNSLGRLMTDRSGRSRLDGHGFTSAAGTGRVDGSDQLFPCPFGQWECGMFLDKRVFIEANNTFLGRGSLAVVLGGNIVVTETVEGEERRLATLPVAIKGIAYDARHKAMRNMLESALEFRMRVSHPGFVHIFHTGGYYPPFQKLSAAAKTPIYSHLTLACSSTGSIADVLKRVGTFSEAEVQHCMAEVLTALQFLHEDQQQVHNDIKSHNILIFDTTAIFPTDYTYQLIDFTGLTPAQTPEEVQRKLSGGLREELGINVVGGTAAFMSPESCLGLGMLASNDIWSLGITAYHMMTNTLPWKSLERQFPSMILNGFRCKYSLETIFRENGVDATAASSGTSCPDSGALRSTGAAEQRSDRRESSSHGNAESAVLREKYYDFGPLLEEFDQTTLSDNFKDFVRQCLIENPMRRPTARELLGHAFVRGARVGVSCEQCVTPIPL